MTSWPMRLESHVCQTPITPVTIGIATMPATSRSSRVVSIVRGSLNTPSSSSRSRKAGIVEIAAVTRDQRRAAARGALRYGPEEGEDAARVGAAHRGVLGAPRIRVAAAAERAARPAAAAARASRELMRPSARAGSRSSDVPATGSPSRVTSQMLSRSSSSSGRASGSPSTTSRSASLPASIVPTCSSSPSAAALAEVAAISPSRGVRPMWIMRSSSSALRCGGPQSKPIAIVTPAARAARIVSAACSTLYCARSTSSVVQVGIGGRFDAAAAAALVLLVLEARADALAEPGHAVEAADRRHEHLAVARHALEQIGALVEVHAVLDRVDALLDRDLGARHALAVRGDAVAHAVRLLDEDAHLLARQLRGVGILELDRARAGRHDLDEVGAVAHLLAHRLADLVGAVGLAVHAGEEAAARAGGRDDPAAGEHARAVEGAVAHRLARLDEQVVVAADVAERRDAHAQQLAQTCATTCAAVPGQIASVPASLADLQK